MKKREDLKERDELKNIATTEQMKKNVRRTSLKENAQRWFSRLPARTVDNGEDSKKKFLA